MNRVRLIAAQLAVCLLSACANFRAASDFASETRKLTGTVGAEFAQLSSLCVEQAQLSIAILDIDEDSADSPLKACIAYSATQGRLADVTVAALDAYAKALQALAENRSFDLGPEIKDTSDKLAALKDRDGSSLVGEPQLEALTTLLVVLADIATQASREEAIQRLVAVKPDLVIGARLMRSFFARPEGTPGSTKTPYENVVTLSADALRSYETLLKSEAVRKAEPIRARELTLSLRPTRALLASRQSTGDDSVPKKIVAAIDAWIGAADSFERDAFRPDPRQFLERLKDLRAKVMDAQAAVRARAN